VRDLIVAGGGPVGLATALYATRAGLDVVVREPRSGPVDKACGEGLMPGAVADLAELGIGAAGVELTGIRYCDPHRSVDAPFRSGPGRGVRRTTLHSALAEAAAAAGVVVEQDAVRTVEQRGDRVLVDGEAARHLVAADGLHSPVRRMLGLEAPRRGPRRFGFRRHLALAPWTSYVEVHWSQRAEAYVTPVAPDCVGLAVLTSDGGDFDDLLRAFPALADRVDGVDGTRVIGAGPLRQRVTRRVAGRVLLVGDASGYVDALTGEGIALGLAQARAAVAAIAAGSPESYERAWQRLSWRHNLLTSSLLSVSSRPMLRRALVPAADRLPVVFRAAVNELARPA
jgi:flavin-dependent dehydrogenase